MGDLTRNFSRWEFACKCGCGYDTVDWELLQLLQNIADHFDAPITVNSCARCLRYNMAVRGSTHSQHLVARAADIVVDGVPASVVADLAEEWGVQGVGRYDDFTHVDTRTDGPARW